MMKLSTLRGDTFYLNPDLIVRVEKAADTLITLSNGDTIRALEEPEVIVEQFMAYKRKINGVEVK